MKFTKPIIRHLQDYWGKITRQLCNELYHQLHINKVKRGSITIKVNKWQVKLNLAFIDNSWQINRNDPYGSIVVHAVISFIMNKPHHNDEPMEVTLDHARLFFHVVSCICCNATKVVSDYIFNKILAHISFGNLN
jgi:hypothetical protein